MAIEELEQDSEGEGSSSEETHLDECDICEDGGDLICCDGCEKAYHADCLKIDADTLPDFWYGPCCAKRRTSPQKKAVSALWEKDAKKNEPRDGEINKGVAHEQSDPSVGGASATNDVTLTTPAKKQSVDSAQLTPQHASPAKNTKPQQFHNKSVASPVDKSVSAHTDFLSLPLKNSDSSTNVDSVINAAKKSAVHNDHVPAPLREASKQPLTNKHTSSQAKSQSATSSVTMPTSFANAATNKPPQSKESFSTWQMIDTWQCSKCKQVYAQAKKCPCTTLPQQPSRQSVTNTTTKQPNVEATVPTKQTKFRTVVVPKGVAEGSVFHVIINETGMTMGVVCPKGVQPGQTIIVIEPGVNTAPISPDAIVKMNESRLVDGFDSKEAEFVRRAFWEVLFPQLKANGWSLTREKDYNFGAYTFYISSSKLPFADIANILNFIGQNEYLKQAVQAFHDHVEKQMDDAKQRSERKRKRIQDDLSGEDKHIRIGSQYQVRSLPRAGTYVPEESAEFIHDQIWSQNESTEDAYNFLHNLSHKYKEHAFCSLHKRGYNTTGMESKDVINSNEEKFKWESWANDSSFAANFHDELLRCSKRMPDVASALKKPMGFCLWYYYSKYKSSDNYVALKNHMRELQIEASRNSDECTICDDGGELLCCDTCVNAYHPKCLGLSDSIALDGKESWSCPVCVRKRTESCLSPAKSPKKSPSPSKVSLPSKVNTSPARLSFTENGSSDNVNSRSKITATIMPPKQGSGDRSSCEKNAHRHPDTSLEKQSNALSSEFAFRPLIKGHPAEKATSFHQDPSNASIMICLKSRSAPSQGQPNVTTSQSANQKHPDGTVQMTQQEKYGYGDRYSLENVAARKNDDGTVAPVATTKLQNGMFARPIGRQRKGMEWDGVRGVWAPIPPANSEET